MTVLDAKQQREVISSVEEALQRRAAGDSEGEARAWGRCVLGRPVWHWVQEMPSTRYAEATAESDGYDLSEEDLASELWLLIEEKGSAPQTGAGPQSRQHWWRWDDGEHFVFERAPDVQTIPALRYRVVLWRRASELRTSRIRPRIADPRPALQGLNGGVRGGEAPLAPDWRKLAEEAKRIAEGRAKPPEDFKTWLRGLL